MRRQQIQARFKRNNKARVSPRERNTRVSNAKQTDLKFLLENYMPMSKWTVEKAQRLLELVKLGAANDNFKAAATEMKIKPSGIKAFLRELRKAAEEGMSLEEYFKRNRPYAIYHAAEKKKGK